MNEKGFTLVELLAVIALIAILSGLAVTNIVSSINNSRKNQFLLDTKRLVSKAEYFVAMDSDIRNDAKSSGYTFSFEKLNEKKEFNSSPDGGIYTNGFVHVMYSNNTYVYCVCLENNKRIVGTLTTCSTSNTTINSGCILSSSLTGIAVVNDK